MTSLHGVDQLVAALGELGDRLEPAAVAALLRALPLDDRSLTPYLTFRPGRYSRNLIARTAAFELMALCWDAGAASSIHDHADSDCAFVLHRGAIRCEDWSRDEGVIERVGETTLRTGDIDQRTGTVALHRVGADGGPAVSLHVYSRPLDRFSVFDEAGRPQLVNARYHTTPPGAYAALSRRLYR